MGCKVQLMDKAEEKLDDLPNNRERILKDLEKLERKPKYFGERRKGFWILKCGYNRGFRAVYTIEEGKKEVWVHGIYRKGSQDYRELY